MNRPLAYLAILITLCTGSVRADDFKPDIHLIEYQFFVPSLWFEGRGSRDRDLRSNSVGSRLESTVVKARASVKSRYAAKSALSSRRGRLRSKDAIA